MAETTFQSQSNAPVAVSPISTQVVQFVGRDAELIRLRQCLAKTERGERQVVFITGEPGIGKTSLIDAFLRQLASHQDLWVMQGQCVEHYGAGEAYLPVLEALGRLGRGPSREEVVATLAQYAPTWLAQLPALVSLAEREGLQRTLLGATRERMLREFADAVEAFTIRHPLVIVFEDLHWSDVSTVDLIAYLAQRRGPVRLLVMATYRPADIQPSHPLKAVVQELQARGRCEGLRLEFLQETEINTYVRGRFGNNFLSPALASLLHQRTGGNPLFMVTVIEHFLREGVIVKEDEQWRVKQDGTALEVDVPDGLRRLIEKHLEGLSQEEQQILEVASIVGVEFAVPTVAAALEQAGAPIEEACEGLAAKGQFVRSIGVEEWPDGTIGGRYGFIHAFYQNMLYERVAEARRIRLHKRIGERKESAYGERVAEVASELAAHFEKGHDYRQTIRYLEQAGKNAIRRHAHQEAIGHLTKGLELLQALPDTPERTQHELTLQLTLVGPLLTGKGYTAPEVEKTYFRARELCNQLGNPPQLSAVLFGLCIFYQLQGEVQKGRELAEQLLTLAHRSQNPTLLLRAHMALGNVSYFLGDFAAAREHLEQGLTFYLPHKHSPLVSNSAQDLGVICLSRAALVLWFLGYPDQARLRSDKGLTVAKELSHPFSEAFALHAAIGVHQECREMPVTSRQVQRLMTLSKEQGFPYYTAWGTILQGWLQTTMQDRGEEGVAWMLQGLAALRIAGSELGLLYFVARLAEAYGKVGQAEEGLAVLAETLEVIPRPRERFYEAELYRLKGELTLQKSGVRGPESGTSNPQSLTPSPQTEAEACFQQALEVARKQQAKSLELRAAMSLGRLWQQQGKRAEARQLLEAIYGWFTEGFETKDLQDAEALLTTLGGQVESVI